MLHSHNPLLFVKKFFGAGGLTFYSLALIWGTVACEEKSEAAQTQPPTVLTPPAEGSGGGARAGSESAAQVIWKGTGSPSYSLLVHDGQVWTYGRIFENGIQTDTGALLLAVDGQSAPQLIGAWDGNQGGRRFATDGTHVFRVNGSEIIQHDTQGKELSRHDMGSDSFGRLEARDGLLVAITQDCLKLLIIDTDSWKTTEIDSGRTELIGGRYGAVIADSTVICAGGGHLLEVDKESLTIKTDTAVDDPSAQAFTRAFIADGQVRIETKFYTESFALAYSFTNLTDARALEFNSTRVPSSLSQPLWLEEEKRLLFHNGNTGPLTTEADGSDVRELKENPRYADLENTVGDLGRDDGYLYFRDGSTIVRAPLAALSP